MACVGGQKYGSQKALSERAKTILRRPAHAPEGNEQRFCCDLVQFYDKCTEQQSPIIGVHTAPNPDTPWNHANCLHVTFANDVEITVALAKVVRSCFDPVATAARRKCEMQLGQLREQVCMQSVAFKKQQQQSDGTLECQKCHATRLKWEDVHADHCGPMEFRHIAGAFLQQQQGRAWESAAWETFHRKRARLQVLCAHCNLTKPKKRKRD